MAEVKPRSGRFSRLRDGINDAPVKIRSPLIGERAIAGRIGAGEGVQTCPNCPDAP